MRRNEEMLRLVLYGSSYTDVSRKYKVTPVRVRQIVVREVYKLRKYIEVPDTGNRCLDDIQSYSLKTLRRMKNRIISVVESNNKKMQMVTEPCASCGSGEEIPPAFNFCPYCGRVLSH